MKTFKDNSSPTVLVNKIFSMKKLNTKWEGSQRGEKKEWKNCS
jgi:hypothetical protein